MSTLHPVHDACMEPPCASHRCAAIRPRCVAARARSRATASARPASGASSARASASIATIEAKPTSYRRICPTAYAPSEETLAAKKSPSYLAGPGVHGGWECVAAHMLRGVVAGGCAARWCGRAAAVHGRVVEPALEARALHRARRRVAVAWLGLG